MKKIAIINLNLSLIQLFVREIIEDKNIISIQQIQLDKIINRTHKILNLQIKKLIKMGFLQQHQIILDITQNVNPIQVCSSCDCQLNILKLKNIQDYLLKNNFQIKIIL